MREARCEGRRTDGRKEGMGVATRRLAQWISVCRTQGEAGRGEGRERDKRTGGMIVVARTDK